VRVSRHGCYHATYPDYITPAFAREQLAIDPQDTVILFFGQFRPYKGFDLLLDAFSELRDKGYKIKLLAAGQAKFDVKPKLVKHLGEDACNVLLVDRVIDDNEVQVFFRAADIAVFPYRNILTSGSLMLSLTFGLPPVIPAVGMTQEVLQGQDAGFLYGLDAPYPSLQVAVEAALKRKEDGSWDNVRSNCESLGRSLDWPVFVDTVLDF
jgi:glycosyltransferase involved in cell wall biosynthesis